MASLWLAYGVLVRFMLVPVPSPWVDGFALLLLDCVRAGTDVPAPEKGVVVEPLSLPVCAPSCSRGGGVCCCC